MRLTPVILAGGGGTRMWPLSRLHYPKQFLTVLGDRSFLQQALTRLAGLGVDDGLEVTEPVVVCNEAHRFLVAEQARECGVEPETIMLEPEGRNTAPALTCAAIRVLDSDAERLLLMMPADHVIPDLEAFHAAVRAGAAQAAGGKLVTFAVTPDRAETGYGYVRLGEALGGTGVHALGGFREKPDAATAAEYVASGEFGWNSGMFLLGAATWCDAVRAHNPGIVDACLKAVTGGKSDGPFFRLGSEFLESPADSIDYAVMEHLEPGQGAAVRLEAGWSDIGSWGSLWEQPGADAEGNWTRGDVAAIDSRNNLLVADSRLLCAVGCEDLVVVETPDAVLVVPREKSQEVRNAVAYLERSGREEHLLHRRVYRPWGSYESVDAGDRFQVKRITVKPGASLSLQMHHHRAEHWIVVRGTARVTRGDEEFTLAENESTFIPLGVTHRLANPGKIPLEIIEVQSGAYLGEDDIVRFQDDYNRA